MQFIELKPEEFRTFADKHPNKSFYQTPEIANLREQNGWTAYYFGVKTAEKLVAASLVVAKPAFLGKSIFYAPGGPLVDYEDTKTLSFFIHHLRHYAKTHNGYVLHIEPYYELIERDRAGEPVENGFNHQKALKNLQNLGFKSLNTSDEPKYAFVLELKNRTPDEIFVDFKRNTRNHIRKAEKKGVKIRELSRAELPIFKQITESTSARRNFEKHPNLRRHVYPLWRRSNLSVLRQRRKIYERIQRPIPHPMVHDQICRRAQLQTLQFLRHQRPPRSEFERLRHLRLQKRFYL